jgi:hypothetical protein
MRQETFTMSPDTFLLFRHRSRGWCAAPPPFRNILSHPIGRGKTQAEAVQDLLGHPEFVHRALSGEWQINPYIADFLEVASDKSFFATHGRPSKGPKRLDRTRPVQSLGAQEARP